MILPCGCSLKDVKSRIGQVDVKEIFIAEQAIEAWFIADKLAIKQLLPGVSDEDIKSPESHQKPFDHIKSLVSKLGSRGFGTKLILANRMVNYYNFSIEQAAMHPKCPSVKYMVDILTK